MVAEKSMQGKGNDVASRTGVHGTPYKIRVNLVGIRGLSIDEGLLIVDDSSVLLTRNN